ncbi:MAG: NfeD family protein [Paludibacter sp.]|jgi:membrane-bound ClpP family serine protease|nr:NfeD family protein [Paludibacter sp.]
MMLTIVIILLIIGVLLFLIELFLIPGISFAGIAATIFMGAAIVLAYTKLGSTAGHIVLVSGLILSVLAIWLFLRLRILEKMSLKTSIDAKNDPLADIIINPGDKAITVSRLAPMGKIKIGDKTIEAKTNDDFIDENTEVRIVKVFSTNVLVERI